MITYAELFQHLKTCHVPSCLFVCGDATANLEVLCRMKPDCLSVDENVCMKDALAVCRKYDVVLGGNIQLTITMLHGSSQDNMKAVIDIIEQCEDVYKRQPMNKTTKDMIILKEE